MASTSSPPAIIQGGMGAGISNWRLAHAVSNRGQLGVVSGVALDSLMVRRLEDGDPGGHIQAAISQFPLQDVLGSIQHHIQRLPRRDGEPYTLLPMYTASPSPAQQVLLMLGAFVEVWLAKTGHGGPVGINLLAKVQPPTLATLYGAMLAGVDYVLMGAGIPRDIPLALDRLAEHQPAEQRLDVAGWPADLPPPMLRFDPMAHCSSLPPPLKRPKFIAIVAGNLLATVMVRKSSGTVDGLVIEGPAAGGHNAPPRGELHLSADGEPVYGARDEVDIAKIRDLGVPFWLAGGTGRLGGLRYAQRLGAAGIQVGTLFAYCEESGMEPSLRRSVLRHAARGDVVVRTDARASPTGFPFKLVDWPENPARGVERRRICDLGQLREAYRTPDGGVGFRCAGEPVEAYIRKGGQIGDTVGRQCLCNALVATAGHAQTRAGVTEVPLVTSGDNLTSIREFLGGRESYHAEDVLNWLLAGDPALQGVAS